ncbi:MAG: hypothetical protein IJ111_06860 [Eggerthellaceae bacterium]|nr:hypothetical protein [Eggerthellaceae bacterium]
MREPTYGQAFQALLLQAADEGRAGALFGDSLARAREAAPAFLVGEEFPGVYLEHPLIGDPFLDVTVLLKRLEPRTRIDSPAAGGHGAMLDWYARARRRYADVTCGFEIDTDKRELPAAAVHFQPRAHAELVRPFCEAAGEPRAADLYLGQGARMPAGWPLSFFGMFRGRPGSPLRVCGYLGEGEKAACAAEPGRLAAAFDVAGFTAYDEAMLSQVSKLMAMAPGGLDFQFDVLPDGRVCPTFAIDVQFGIERPEAVQASFESGPSAAVMDLLEGWGAADVRWRQAARSSFARALPVELEDGGIGRYSFALMPQWVKARWTNCELQPAKLYHLAHAGLLG